MTTWVRNMVKARKPHRCVLCYRTIDAGETYLRGTALERGEAPRRWIECAHCSAVQRIYDIQDDSQYDNSMFDDWSQEPRDVTELRHAAGYRMRWRTRGGTLLPVPTLEAVAA